MLSKAVHSLVVKIFIKIKDICKEKMDFIFQAW